MNEAQQQLFPMSAAYDARKAEQLREVNELIADILHNVRDAVHGTRCRVAVCGGAARDIALGTVPRDIDLVIQPHNEDDVYVALAALELGLGYRIEKDFAHSENGFLFPVQFDSDYESVAHDGRWSRVVKLVAPNKPGLDILVTTADSLEDAIAAFDFNINQFAILNPHCKPRFFGERPGELVQNRSCSVSPDRVAHITSIARLAGWSI
jgi:hypothetical protein